MLVHEDARKQLERDSSEKSSRIMEMTTQLTKQQENFDTLKAELSKARKRQVPHLFGDSSKNKVSVSNKKYAEIAIALNCRYPRLEKVKTIMDDDKNVCRRCSNTG